eukprot:TRINITY_DN697_c0_g1_i5.p1 TRINITY_DN697_c0_g1~~TRINITY_DN697_c0_g1_i5.p1  ORF type:complete len:150 (+),score=32.70 TRINITY_DN697_c0_g1_i5:365-814(+)
MSPVIISVEIDYPIVIGAAVLAWMFGALWYGFFGNTWMKLNNFEERFGKQWVETEMGTDPLPYIGSFLTTLLTSIITFHMHKYMQITTYDAALKLSTFLALGYHVSTNLNHSLYERTPVGLFLINAGYAMGTYGCVACFQIFLFGLLET